MQGLKKNWLVVSNMTWVIWWVFTQLLKGLKLSLWWSLWAKKYRAVILWYQKWQDELDELSLEHSEVWIIVSWWVLFVQSILCFSWMENFRRIILPSVITLRSASKFKEKLTRGLKNDKRNLVNFSCEQSKAWKYALWWVPFVENI